MGGTLSIVYLLNSQQYEFLKVSNASTVQSADTKDVSILYVVDLFHLSLC